MFHISRKSLLKLEPNSNLSFEKFMPNNALNSLVSILEQLNGAEGLIKILKSFSLLKDFDVKTLFNNWGSNTVEKNLIPIIRKHRVEIVYEHVRQKHFPNLISRYEAFYLTENPAEWIAPLKIQEDYTLYQFDSSELEAEHYYAHWTELSRMSDNYDTVYEQAINYWSCIKPADDNRFEILALGKFSVVNKNVISVDQTLK